MHTDVTKGGNGMQSVKAYQKERARARIFGHVRRCWQLYLLLVPAVVYIFIFNYMPLYGIQIAFRNYSPRKGYLGSQWVGLKYFERFFSSPDCWRLIKNTLTVSIYSLVVGFPLPILVALMLNQCTMGGFKKLVQNVVYAPHFVSMVVLVGMINVMFSVNSGVFNTMLEHMGMERVLFTGRADLFPHMYVWSGVWQNMGWNSIIYFAALSSVSEDLHDAAIVDGATKFQRILNIDLPTIMPTITIMLVLQIGQIMNVGFEKVYLMQNNLNLQTSETIQTYVYKQGLQNADYGYSTAVGLFNNVVNFVLLFTVNNVTRRMGGSSLW